MFFRKIMKKKVLIIFLLLAFPMSTIGLPHIINYCICTGDTLNNECSNAVTKQNCKDVHNKARESNETMNSVDCCKKELLLNTINDSFLNERAESQSNNHLGGLDIVPGNCAAKCKIAASNQLSTEIPLIIITNKIYLKNSILII